jgi:hypothetical protein
LRFVSRRDRNPERSADCFISTVTNEVFLKGDPSTDSVRRQMERMLNDPRSRQLGKAAVAGAAAWGMWRLFRVIKPLFWRGASSDSRQL